jgi:uncharacterized protein YdiU (UPF0061 family)
MLPFVFDNTYARELPGTYVAWKPVQVPAPRLLFFNDELAGELGLGAQALAGPEVAAVFAGNVVPEGAEPLAQAYAGHQFGGFSPQLGDGRALLLGEVIDRHGQRRDIAFKGSGRTPFSRGGDGKAAVGPMLREVIVGEAMHALGIPTTRALAVVATGEPVFREAVLPGAVLTRVAASHLRVGTFQFFAARGDLEHLRKVLDYAIVRHDPALAAVSDARERCFGLLRAVAQRQASLIAQWMNVGFIHGVMNTDNMTISGETIDYGPCAFMEAMNPEAVFSSIDHGGRYAYGNQPLIARWNLAKLAEALLPLAVANPDDEAQIKHAVAEATEVIDAFPAMVAAALLQGQRAKLGLQRAAAADDRADAALVADWLALLHRQRIDFTLAWRRLADAADGDAGSVGGVGGAGGTGGVGGLGAMSDEDPLRALFADGEALGAWLQRWRQRCAADDAVSGTVPRERAARMRRVNPIVIPRNHLVEKALAAASENDDLASFEGLLAAVRMPFEDSPAQAAYSEPAPAEVTEAYQTFCGT